MEVLMVHVEDDWTEYPTNETKAFADSPVGLVKALDYIDEHIPWEEAHMKAYFKGCVKKLSGAARTKISKLLETASSVTDFDTDERYPARFHFSISREEVIGS